MRTPYKYLKEKINGERFITVTFVHLYIIKNRNWKETKKRKKIAWYGSDF